MIKILINFNVLITKVKYSNKQTKYLIYIFKLPNQKKITGTVTAFLPFQPKK